MAIDPALLQSLRALFRDELQDQIGLLRRQHAALAAGTDAPSGPALAACYRAAHTIKGAAQAAAYPALARFSDALESHFERARRDGTLDGDALGEAIETLHRAAEAVTRGTALDESALRQATTRLEAPRIPRAPSTPPRPAPEPATDGTPAVHMAIATPQAADEAPTSASETVRLRVRHLDELSHASEELLGLDDRESLSREDATTEGVWSGLFASLAAAERAAKSAGAGDVVRAIGRAVTAARLTSVAVWAKEARFDRFRRASRAGITTMSEALRTMRLTPLATMEPWLTQAVAQGAEAVGRRARLVFEAPARDVDRRLLDALREPLLHLVRNAVDHGIEPAPARLASGKPAVGTITVKMTLDGLELQVEVQDDGRGVSLDEVRAVARRRGLPNVDRLAPNDVLELLFEPGFSTVDAVGQLSGRGVGLDIVRDRITTLRGRIDVDAAPGKGMTICLSVPLALSVTRGVIARVGDATYVLQSACIHRVLNPRDDELRVVDGLQYVDDAGTLIPLCDVGRTLGLPSLRGAHHTRNLVLVHAGGARVALPVDALVDEREVIARSLGPRLRRVPFVISATELGGGEVALVLDLVALARRAVPLRAQVRDPARLQQTPRILVVDDAATTRHLEAMILEHAGLHVTAVEDGQVAWESLLSGAAFDAVVTDLEMPRMDGFELLTRIRAVPAWQTLPVLVMTAREDDESHVRALTLGATHYLRKSEFDADTLLSLLPKLHP